VWALVIAVSNIYSELTTGNYLFNNPNVAIGDDLLLPWIKLKNYLEKRGILLCTPDTVKIDNIDKFIFLDMPHRHNPYLAYACDSKKPAYLIICESEIINSENQNYSLHQSFKKIFTYNDSLVDNKKYFKMNYCFDLPRQIDVVSSRKVRLCAMIAGNKIIDHPLELYSERIAAIRWFEKYHPGDFDLYGGGWDSEICLPRLPYKVKKLVGKLKFVNNLFRVKYPSYRGAVVRKHPILSEYKFSICYENARDVPGYITEKVFDCFFAACIPIYWGAGNVADHIPSDCFIDKRNFKNMESLYKYIKTMTVEEYGRYIDSIREFIGSQMSYPFSIDCFMNTIIEEIVEDSFC